MTNAPQRKLGKALAAVRLGFGFQSTYDACVAQKHLTLDQYRNRESGRSAFTLEELFWLARDWGIAPIELFCLLSEELNDSAYLPIAEKFGLTLKESQKRFQAKQRQTGMEFEQLFLLVMKDQVSL